MSTGYTVRSDLKKIACSACNTNLQVKETGGVDTHLFYRTNGRSPPSSRSDHHGAGEPDNSVAVTPSAAKVKCTIISGFRSASVAGLPSTFTVVAGVTLYVLASVDIEFLGSTVTVMAVASTETISMYTIFGGIFGFGAA